MSTLIIVNRAAMMLDHHYTKIIHDNRIIARFA